MIFDAEDREKEEAYALTLKVSGAFVQQIQGWLMPEPDLSV